MFRFLLRGAFVMEIWPQEVFSLLIDCHVMSGCSSDSGSTNHKCTIMSVQVKGEQREAMQKDDSLHALQTAHTHLPLMGNKTILPYSAWRLSGGAHFLSVSLSAKGKPFKGHSRYVYVFMCPLQSRCSQNMTLNYLYLTSTEAAQR